jgi:hypothetical protein
MLLERWINGASTVVEATHPIGRHSEAQHGHLYSFGPIAVVSLSVFEHDWLSTASCTVATYFTGAGDGDSRMPRQRSWYSP